ncbi:hypothetical protein ACQ4PT_027691 [Festuca glaucescens]
MAPLGLQLLPEDILACILRRLAPRSLAASRGVCKSWCALVDECHLLRTDLLPLSLYGIFFLEGDYPSLPKFFASHLIQGKIAAMPDYLNRECVLNHCNGLLLLWDEVVNPATRQRVVLPSPPPLCAGMEKFFDDRCLVFDPTVSPHYEVLHIPSVPPMPGSTAMFADESEWPPSRYPIQVFSSRTWTWEERLFVRRGEAAGTIADMKSDEQQEDRYAVYWKGAVYVHAQNDSIIRIILSDGEYEVINSPTSTKLGGHLHLGKSEKGVYYALTCSLQKRIQVWLLTDSCGRLEWILKNDIGLVPMFENISGDQDEHSASWMLHKGSYDEDAKETHAEDKLELNFENGIILEAGHNTEWDYRSEVIHFLGFHPCKEVAFLWLSEKRES